MQHRQSPLAAAVIAAFTLMAAGSAGAHGLSPVATANAKIVGASAANALSPELRESVVAQGANRLENPSGSIAYYGYLDDGPLVPPAGVALPTVGKVEASKTEPDKNTYLILAHQHGADASYHYGSHFLFQGHEGNAGYITRINLDADAAHRVTLLATTTTDGTPLPTFDGSTWYPFSKHLLFTAESGSTGGVWQATADYPSKVVSLQGIIGIGGYEGIQSDSDGNLWIVEDVGGKTGTVNTKARQPNSFVYRFVPKNRHDLTRGGTLQVLQVASKSHAGPIVFTASNPDDDILSVDVRDLHTYGQQFDTKWVTIHDTDVDGTTPFFAIPAAQKAGGTSFKRPENGQFRPGSGFREFFFSETGDTNALTQAGEQYGGFGGVFKISQAAPSANVGTLTMLYRGNVAHSGFDNVAFWSRNEVVFVEDAGDTLHTQRNALDSAYVLDVRKDYSDATLQPLRILALGRDASATIDSGLGSLVSGFQNDGDNEITGIHVSDGDPGFDGLLGAKIPTVFRDGWRVFYTQQHGDNNTFEILPASITLDRNDD